MAENKPNADFALPVSLVDQREVESRTEKAETRLLHRGGSYMAQAIETRNREQKVVSKHNTRTRLLLWLVGVLSLAWNAMGALDYTMSQTHNKTWLAAATTEQRAYIDAFPAWMVAFWALGVWGAVVGSVLVLARSRHAVTAFSISLTGLAVTTAYQWLIAPPRGVRSASEIGFMAALWVVAIGLLYFAKDMRSKGGLR